MISAWIGSVAFFAVSILYILLALGFPYGHLAMGGRFKVLPIPMRVACAISVLVQWLAIVLVLQAGQIISIEAIAPYAIGGCYFFAAYLAINTVMNAASRSKPEKLLMTPLSLATAVCFLVTALYA